MNGEIVLTFHDGHLYNILFRLSRPLTPAQCDLLKKNIPFVDYYLHEFANVCGLHYEPIIETTAMDKVALFMKAYHHHLGLDYQKQKLDHLMIKKYDVTEALLNTYFTSDNVLFKEKHSIGNFCKFYNQLRAENAGAYKQKRFPDRYDVNFIRTIKTTEDLQEYYAHLRGIGLKPKFKPDTSQIIDFVKPENA